MSILIFFSAAVCKILPLSGYLFLKLSSKFNYLLMIGESDYQMLLGIHGGELINNINNSY